MPRTTALTIGCLLICAGFLAAGLWPFNFREQNGVGIAADGSGLEFRAPFRTGKNGSGGLVFSAAPLACGPVAACEPGSLAIRIELQAQYETASCVNRFLELRRADDSIAFYLGQWKSSLIVRSFNAPPAAGKRYREMGVGGALAPGRSSVITIVSGPQGTDFFQDGRPVKSYPGLGLLKENETAAGHRLYLGGSPELGCPWAGRVRELALYGQAPGAGEEAGGPGKCGGGRCGALAWFRFDRAAGETIEDLSGSGNDLRKPVHLVFHKRLLGLPDGHTFSRPDLAVNLAGFVPFGFLVCLRFLAGGGRPLRVCILAATIAGLAVSLAIETTQAWLPGRDSSFLDLGANTLGAAAGALLASGWREKKIPPGPPLPKGEGRTPP
jgi:hypothetical protein